MLDRVRVGEMGVGRSCIRLVCVKGGTDGYRYSFLPLYLSRRYRKALAEEAEIMKHVPGWKAGESVYKTKVTWIPPRCVCPSCR